MKLETITEEINGQEHCILKFQITALKLIENSINNETKRTGADMLTVVCAA